MALRLRDNPYQGVNPHLQSWLQSRGKRGNLSKWPGFHSAHIVNIVEALNLELPRGYVAQSEQSLQIRVEDLESGYESYAIRAPDVSIYRSHTTELTATAPDSTAPIILSLSDTLELTEDFVSAIVVYEISEDADYGHPVTRIELLSPSNLRFGSNTYAKNRLEAIYSEVALVEIQYIHELPAPIFGLPDYPYHPESHAYSIYVSDPRPSVEAGKFLWYGFDVDDPFPPFRIPLLKGENLVFNLGNAYAHTFRGGRWDEYVDYSQLPLRFETYHPRDQAIIQVKMAAIAGQAEEGNREQGIGNRE